MIGISIHHKGNFSKTDKYLRELRNKKFTAILTKYGEEGVRALQSATPKDTGNTAHSWSYKIEDKGNKINLVFTNSNVNKGVNIAIILQYGHGTRNGGYVEGRDYINPALQPIFDKISKEAWEEVTKL